MHVLTLWLISLMTVLSPPDRDAALVASKHRSAETGEERAARYSSVAADMAAAVQGHALPYLTEKQTAALLVSAAFYESSFHPDVDSGACNEKVTYDPKRICDGGASVGLLQIHFGRGQTSFLGKTFDELRGPENRPAMFAAGLAAMRVGVTACSRQWRAENRGWKLTPSLALTKAVSTTGEMVRRGLSWYARGSCESASGLADGEKKMKLLHRLLNDRRFPKLEAIQQAELARAAVVN